MECVVGVLLPETTDDFAGDDLFVDEFLDFSNEHSETEEEEEEEEEPQEELGTKEQEKSNNNCNNNIMTTCSVSVCQDNNSSFSEQNYGFAPLPEPELELGLHGEGFESLEWLSHFSDDSFPDYSLTGKFPTNPPANATEPAEPVQEQPCFTTPVQTKARTKRGRTGVRIWPVLSHSSSSTSSTSSTASLPAAKKHRKRKHAGDEGAAAAAQQPRRCSHCGVTKTPQWRAGPLGSKTLCNACGVRFKSGRLLPEYRPACSPTFSSELHSNNHRKVLEMRRKKEEVETAGVGTVRSF